MQMTRFRFERTGQTELLLKEPLRMPEHTVTHSTSTMTVSSLYFGIICLWVISEYI